MPTISPQSGGGAYDPHQEYAPLVHLRENWADEWELEPELRMTGGTVQTAGHGHSQLQLIYPYGQVSQLWERAYAQREAKGWRGWWIRLDLVGRSGPRTQFVGRIATETRVLEGQAEGPSGDQAFTAYGPQSILDKIWFSRSYWRSIEVGGNGTGKTEIGWTPSMNLRDRHGTLIGNRSAQTYDDVYLFGPDQIWTHKQFLEYLLQFHVDETASGGPTWTIGGQHELLDDLTTVVELDDVNSIGQVIRRLVNPQYGVDYMLRATEDGFEIEVFALVAEDYTYNGVTLPKNPNEISYQASGRPANVRTIIERSDAVKYNTVRVVGRRAVCCCSAGGLECPVSEIAYQTWPTPLLVGKWADNRETEYKAGAGTDSTFTAKDHDIFRQDDRFELVYQAWGLPGAYKPEELGQTAGFTLEGEWWGPYAVDAERQLQVRSTLDWLPLRESVDYTGSPPFDESGSDEILTNLRSPCVWLSSIFENARRKKTVYQRADMVNVGLTVPSHDWGVRLSCSPNHLVASGLFSPSLLGDKLSERWPQFDPDLMAVTIAFETDQRILAETLIDEDAGPSAGVLEIFDGDIECWFLAPHTILGIDEEGDLITSGSDLKVLRLDTQRIGMVMAGAIARYRTERARATIIEEGLQPWVDLLGYILKAVEDGGSSHEIRAPITSIEWGVGTAGQKSTTTIRTGFAR